MKKKLQIALQASFFLVTITAPIAHAQVAQAVGAVSTSMTIDQIFSGLQDLIRRAQDAGDYVTMRAAMQAKDVLDVWKQTNGELLEKTFTELDSSQQKLINNIRQTVDSANSNIKERTTEVQKLVVQTNQITEGFPYTKNTYVLNYSPRVKPAQTTEDVSLRLQGVNLDRGDVTLLLSNGGPASRMIVGPTEVRFTIPASELTGDVSKVNIKPLKLTYTTPLDGFWNRLVGNRQRMEREIPIIMLPQQLAKFTYDVNAASTQRIVKVVEVQEQLFQGRNETVRKVALPPQGWKWDWAQGPNAFSQVSKGGEAAHCNGIWAHESSENGITHSARVDRIFVFPSKYGDGWHRCAVKGPVYQEVAGTKAFPTESGALNWIQDVALELPPKIDSFKLQVTMFDGRTRLFTDTGSDKFLDVLRDSSSIIIRPKQPDDL